MGPGNGSFAARHCRRLPGLSAAIGQMLAGLDPRHRNQLSHNVGEGRGRGHMIRSTQWFRFELPDEWWEAAGMNGFAT
ncbi:hypothetical protein RSO01_62230 [Reyranella soli]|uniref:Uncharacterized protein n=1 Tax=Reyranella soli TaxID=1230389 RepID=A0A512NJD1_9HYPH|nr:hypothetical protein RSO01_62230 [Reyranella soli]